MQTARRHPHDRPQSPGSAAPGLSSVEAAAKLAEVGPNEIPPERPEALLSRVGRQVREPMALLLLGAAVVSWAGLHEPESAIAILAIVALNTAIGMVQEGKAERSLAALEELEAPTARVERDGQPVVLPARELVPGDVVILGAGDRVPADVLLLEAASFQVDESMITGESLPVSKSAGSTGTEGRAFSGTLAIRGTGRAVVTATGKQTELGAIAAELRAKQPATPLQRELGHLTGRLGTIALAVAACVSALTLVRVGVSQEGLQQSFLTGVALAVAAVPEGLATVVTVGLALGVSRMAREGAIIRRLPAVETLGSATVILSDKTGTLTENRMRLDAVAIPGRNAGPLADHSTPTCSAIRDIAVRCNDASGDPATGDPVDVALLEAFDREGIDEARSSSQRIASMPFDPELRRMTTIDETPTGLVLSMKGAPEVVVSRCRHAMNPDGTSRPLDDRTRERVLAGAAALTGGGMRVLALARRSLRGRPDDVASAERDLELVAMVGLRDPPRAEAAPAVAEASAAGIEIVMVTGDHPGTASAIAAEVGLHHPTAVLTGDELAQGGIPDDPLAAARVYARTRPGDKLALVEALRRRGNIVAVTGDGVNDAPALRRADIGVAMGRSGSDVAREASDMIVTDDNLATIVTAVREGRGIYDNIRKVVDYLVAGNLSEILVVVSTLLAFPALGVPLLPLQLLWVNLLTDGLPAVALGVDPVDPTLMRRPPRRRDDRMLSTRRVGLLLGRGALMATAAVVSLVVARFGFHEPWAHARTVMLTVLIGTHLLYAFIVSGGIRRKWLLLAVGAGLVLQTVILVQPGARGVFSTASLSIREWTLVLALAAAPIAAMGIGRAVLRRAGAPAR